MAPPPITFWENGSGSWFTVSSPGIGGWDEFIPNLGIDAAALIQNITITIAAGSAAARSLTMQGPGIGLSDSSALINMSGGSLEIGTASPVGNVTQTGGTLRFRNAVVNPDGSLDFTHAGKSGTNSAVFNLVQSATGTVLIDSGVLALQGGLSSIAGTIGGANTLADPVAGVVKFVVNGQATLEATAVLDVDAFEVSGTGSRVTLNGDRAFGGAYSQGGVSQFLDLNGHSFTLNGANTIGGGIDGPGTMVLNGPTTMSGTTVSGAAILNVQGAVTHTTGFFNTMSIGVTPADTAALTITASGTWSMAQDGVGFTLSASASFNNAGLFQKTGGAGTINVNVGIINNTGTIKVDSGILAFNSGTGSFGGHLTGSGDLRIGGDGGQYTLASGLVLDVATFRFAGTGAQLTLGGDLSYGGSYTQFSQLNLSGHTLTLSGTSNVQGSLVGPGTVVIEGAAELRTVITSGAVLDVAGTATRSGAGLTIGTSNADTSKLNIQATGLLDITSDVGVTLSQAATLDNAGTIRKSGGAGESVIAQGTVTNAGEIEVLSGRLTIGFGALNNTGTMEAGNSALLRILSAFANNGSVLTNGGSVLVTSAVTGTGSMTIGNNGLLELRDGVAATQTVNFAAGAAGKLQLGLGGSFAGSLSGFNANDALQLDNISATGATVSGSTLTITRQSGAALNFALGSMTANGLTIDVKNGTSQISYTTTATFAGPRSEYTISSALDANGLLSTQVIDTGPAGDGTHTLVGYLKAQFTNAIIDVPRLQLVGAVMQVIGGNDNDVITGNSSANVLNGGGAADTLTGGDGGDTLNGDSGNDTLNSGSGNDTVNGGGGNDLIIAAAGAGNDSYDGGADLDTVTFASAAQAIVVNLSAASNHASGAEIGIDQIVNVENVIGGAGGDTITGNASANALTGGGGDDRLDGRGGNDTMNGGDGNDWFFVDNAADVVNDAVGQGTADRVFASASYTLGAAAQIEIVSTTDHAGTAAINLTGNGFAQALQGNAGNNILDGRGGADAMVGRAGNDWFYVDNAGDTINDAAGEGTQDRVFASAHYGLNAGAQIEIVSTTDNASTVAINLSGNEFGQTLQGNAGNNVLDGKGGADAMVGRAGNDSFYVDNAGDTVNEQAGEGTADRVFASVSYALGAAANIEILSTTTTAGTGAINLTGNALAQTIYGNNGANILNGGAGNDTLQGFSGADVYLFNTALNAATNVDTIVGYSVSQNLIQLENAVFAGLANGALAAGAFRIGAAAQDADDRIVYNNTTGALIFDANGSAAGGATQFATLASNLAMTAAEFFVV